MVEYTDLFDSVRNVVYDLLTHPFSPHIRIQAEKITVEVMTKVRDCTITQPWPAAVHQMGCICPADAPKMCENELCPRKASKWRIV